MFWGKTQREIQANRWTGWYESYNHAEGAGGGKVNLNNF